VAADHEASGEKTPAGCHHIGAYVFERERPFVKP
jgi:hypothetical protein